MTVKIKFFKPVSAQKFMHHLVNAKKRSSNYKHLAHGITPANFQDKVLFQLADQELTKQVVSCDIEFISDEKVEMECESNDYSKSESLLVFDLLESISERAFVRFLDTKFYYSGSQFFVITDGPKPIIYRISSDRNNLTPMEDCRIYREIMEENSRLDLF